MIWFCFGWVVDDLVGWVVWRGLVGFMSLWVGGCVWCGVWADLVGWAGVLVMFWWA